MNKCWKSLIEEMDKYLEYLAVKLAVQYGTARIRGLIQTNAVSQ